PNGEAVIVPHPPRYPRGQYRAPSFGCARIQSNAPDSWQPRAVSCFSFRSALLLKQLRSQEPLPSLLIRPRLPLIPPPQLRDLLLPRPHLGHGVRVVQTAV